jgi:hypothetical protein
MSFEHRQKKVEINGRSYTLITFGAEKSWEIFPTITSMIGEASGDFGQMAMTVLGHKDGLKLIKTLLTDLSCEGMSVKFDEHFAQHRGDLLPCIAFSLSENVLPFLGSDSLASMAAIVEKAMEGLSGL